MVRTGLENFLKDPPADLKGRRVGLLCHQASVDGSLRPAWRLLKGLLGDDLRLLFSPQHGLFGEQQANMIPSADFVEEETGLPVISLYGPRLAPEPEHLAEIDVLLVDLQDVGCRVYTYIWTLLLAMEACAREGKEVVVLDRPNPLGRAVEGPMLDPELVSFVGLHPLPMRHGLTIGELALHFRHARGLDLALRVVPFTGWDEGFFPDTGLPWVPPSPNMPRFETALVYPGQVMLEGTNLSEGRGTTTPFEVFGAPWLAVREVLSILPELPGAVLRGLSFEPWFDKWAGRSCRGLALHVVEAESFRPVRTTLTILAAIAGVHEEFAFRWPPYEFEWQAWPFDIIVGTKAIRERLLERETWEDQLDAGIEEFQELTRPFRLYHHAQ
ncbi:MAG: DUF1343 domain-containing protein [Thermodesulfobacteria bacterium]|nr:DUF1343 domain-containing protein [Thermodesulfobacteriota bacterium]